MTDDPARYPELKNRSFSGALRIFGPGAIIASVTVAIEKFRLAAILWVGGGGLALLWGLDKDPVVIVTPAALVGSSLTCGLWCFAIMWSDRVHTPKALRMGAKLKIALLISGIFLTFIPMVGITKYVQGFF